MWDSNFSNTSFQNNDVTFSAYEVRNKIIITNFPNKNTPGYSIKGKEESFRITPNGLKAYTPTTNTLPTFFVFKSPDNKEMAKVQFNITTKRLVVTSTGVSYGGQDDSDVFSFQVNIGVTNKYSASIKSNENANNFKNTLNDKDFEYYDTVILGSSDKTKIDLENYPNLGDTYNIADINTGKFTITKKGVIPALTLNLIIVKSKSNEEVLTVGFIESTKKIIVLSTGVVPDSTSMEPYFTFILKKENGQELFRSVLYSNENGNAFEKDLDGKSIEFGSNILILAYRDKSKIQISNYPNIGEYYTPNLSANIFTVLPNVLEDLSFRSKIKIINDNSEEVSTLYFIKARTQPIVNIFSTATDKICTNQIQSNKKYAQYLHYDVDNIDLYAELLGKENSKAFSTALNNTKFESRLLFDVLRLSNRINERIIINDYKGENEYKIGEEPEFIEVTFNELIPHDLNYNKIRFKNNNGSSILFIYFDKFNDGTLYIEPYSTGVTNNDSNNFSFKILDITERNEKFKQTINKGENGDSIDISKDGKNTSKNIKFGDVLELEYSNGNLVEIFDFPFITPPSTLPNTSQKFMIGENRLENITSSIPNTLIINSLNNTAVVAITFDTSMQKLKAILFNEIADNSSIYDYIVIKFYHLIDSALAHPIYTTRLKSNESPVEFVKALNAIYFIYDFILEITCDNKSLNKVNITNFENKGKTHILTKNMEYFKVTTIGLVPFTPTSILQDNIIKVSRANAIDLVALSIEFDIASKTIKATATNNPIGISDGLTSTSALIFTLKDQNGTTKKYEYVYGRDDYWTTSTRDGIPVDFANKINNTPFDYGYSVQIYAPSRPYNTITKTLLFISNLPFKSNQYGFFNDTETFTITPLGLVLQSGSPLSNASLLKNIIIIKNSFNNLMAQIYFDIKSKKLLVSSTSIKESITSSMDYIVFKLTDKVGNDTISRITDASSADDFATSLSEKVSFDFGYTISFSGKAFNLSKVSIENYPNYGDTYTSLNTSQKITITETGLVLT